MYTDALAAKPLVSMTFAQRFMPTPVLHLPWGQSPRSAGEPPNLLAPGDRVHGPLSHQSRVVWAPDRRILFGWPAPFGARPLYFAVDPDGIRLSSSALALARGMPPGQEAIDPAGAIDHLGGEPSVLSRTVFRGVSIVPARSYLHVDPTHGRWALRPVRWPSAIPADEWNTAKTIGRAVARSLDPQGTVVLLSGGLDSAILLSVAARTGTTIRAVSLDDGSAPREVEQAARLARLFGVAHRVVSLSTDQVVDAFRDAVLTTESLLWNGRAAAKLAFYRELHRNGDRTLLSGVGADELFWGNPTWWDAPADTLCKALARLAADRAWARLCADDRVRFEAPVCPLDRPAMRRFLLEYTLPCSTLPPETWSASRLAMDVRLPYLCLQVVRCALGHPWEALTQDGQGKLLLRRLARATIPAEVADAPKMPVLARAPDPRSEQRQRWAAEFHRWVRPLGLVNKHVVADWLLRYEHAPADDPDLSRMERMLTRLASLSILRSACQDSHLGSLALNGEPAVVRSAGSARSSGNGASDG